MDRTAEFRQLAGVGLGAALPTPATSAGGSLFMRSVMQLSDRLGQLWRDVHRDPEQVSSAIQACQEDMKKIEIVAEDLSDLGPLAPMPPQDRDLRAHRKGTVSCLYEELREIASRVQEEQVREMQREAEAASFFSASIPAPSARARNLPPKPPGEQTYLEAPAPVTAAEEQTRHNMEKSLLMSIKSDLDQQQAVQAKLEQVAGLVNLFSTKVTEQEEMIANIEADTEEATLHVEEAEKHLKRAVTNSNSYRFYVVCWFIGSAVALLIFDYVDARYSWI